jgi:hypothetical protein
MSKAANANAPSKPSANVSNSKNSKAIAKPPIIVRGKSFTIYGEIHTDIDNRFYEQLYPSLDESYRILVEKTTSKRFLQTDFISLALVHPNEQKFIDKTVKGSEWIFLTSLIRDNRAEPIDIRVENGFPDSRTESELFNFAMKDPIGFVKSVMEIITVITLNKKAYNKPGIKELFDPIMAKIQKQIFSFLWQAKEYKIDKDNLDNLCTHIRYIGVLFVDSHILDIILENNEEQEHKKNLAIFVGARHAINLYHFLKQNGIKEEDIAIEKTAKGEKIEPVTVLE